MRIIALAVLSTLMRIACANAQEPAPLVFGPWNQGVQTLTAETYNEAIECGKQFHSGCGDVLTAPCDLASINVSLTTPFSRVLWSVQSDIQNFKPIQPPTFLKANSDGVIFIIRPVSDFTLIQSVARAV